MESSKLQGITPGRTMQAVRSEVQELQEKVDALSRKVEQKREKQLESRRQIGIIETNVNELKAQKVS